MNNYITKLDTNITTTSDVEKWIQFIFNPAASYNLSCNCFGILFTLFPFPFVKSPEDPNAAILSRRNNSEQKKISRNQQMICENIDIRKWG